MNELYKTVKHYYPNHSDFALDRLMNVGNGYTGKVRRGRLTGIKAAEWLVERHPECQHLLDEARAEAERKDKRRNENGQFAKTPERGPKMNRMCMAMAGYLP